jgi:hypothetical protein
MLVFNHTMLWCGFCICRGMYSFNMKLKTKFSVVGKGKNDFCKVLCIIWPVLKSLKSVHG